MHVPCLSPKRPEIHIAVATKEGKEVHVDDLRWSSLLRIDMIPWLKWLLGHVKAWFHVFMGVSDSEMLQVHMDDPPITASLGPLDRLISQLQSFEGSKQNLPVEFSANEIGLLIEHLKQFCNPMKKFSELEDTSFIDKWWMKEVRDLCYDTEDYLDEVMMQYGACAPRTWTRLLLEDVRIPAPLGRIAGVIIFWIRSKLKWCPQLSDFLARAKVLKGRCPSSVKKDKVDDTCLSKEITADTSLRKQDRADIENLTAQLVEMLAFDDKQTQLKVVPIYGLAGAGKTILARTLYAKYKRRFQCWAFVRVSRNPDIRSILTSILSQIKAPPSSPPMSQVQDLILSISTHLKTKRYFVVIDNIRRTSIWDIISRALPGDNCGSRIIITTETEHVASACSGYYLGSTIFQMDALNACTDTITSEEKNKDINLRYNNLPPHLKTCLLFLGMHPEGCTIRKNNLVKQWVAEGFIPGQKRQDTEEIPQENRDDFSETLQDQAEEIAPVNQDQREEIFPVNQDQREEIAGGYFDELVTRGMIQPVDRDHKGEVLSCTVHHMVLDLIRYKSKNDNFLVVVDNLESTLGHPDIVRRLSVQFGCEKGASIPESIILSQVRSLTFYGFLECLPSIPDYRLLRVLLLNIWADEDKIFDLTRIGELYHLRYLKIECNVTVRLPSEIRRLQHLGTLELHAEVVAIPSDIGHLEKLMHVCCPSKADVRDLGDLTRLLDLQLTCSTVENLEEHMKCLRSILEKLSSLRCLALVPASGSCGVNTPPANNSGMCISGDSLSIVSPAHLQRLELPRRCCIFSRLPKWLGELAQLCILKIAVGELSGEDTDILKGMPALTSLSLHVQPMSAGRIIFGKGGFSVLTYFKITCTVPRLEFEAHGMPNLEKLKLCFNSPIVDEQGTTRIIFIESLLRLKEISVIIGYAGVDAGSAWRKAIKNDSRNPKVQLMGSIYSSDQGRGMETREGSRGDNKNEADSRVRAQQESSRLHVPAALHREEEPEDQPLVSEIVSIPSESESTDGYSSGNVVMHGKQTGSTRNSGGGDRISQIRARAHGDSGSLGSQVEVNPAAAPHEPFRGGRGTPPEIKTLASGFTNPEKTVKNISTKMGGRFYEQHEVLEHIHAGVAQPRNLPLALLEDITENFSEERKIGEGGFGTVYKGFLQNKNVAVKKILVNKYTVDDRLFRREVESLMEINNHPNLVRLLGFCSNRARTVREMTGSEEKIYPQIVNRLLCFEYISNGSLDKHITDELRGLTWDTRFDIIRGICEGLRYLHMDNCIIHMDLKPTNILLDDHMVPKLKNFGLSRSIENTHPKGERFITRGYCAPEYQNNGIVSDKADIYSLGVIIVELVTGSKQIPNENHVLRRWRHRWNKLPTQQQCQQVIKCMEIAACCSEKEPKDRPSISDIIRDLSETGSTKGSLDQTRLYLYDDMLGIEPLELRIPLEHNKQISCLVKLSNETSNYIAFNIRRPSKQYSAGPEKGIVLPGCKRDVTITLQPQKSATKVTNDDKFVVQSTKVEEGLADEDITNHMFNSKGSEVVDEVNLIVIYEGLTYSNPLEH